MTAVQPMPTIPYHRILTRPGARLRLLLVVVLCPVGLIALSVAGFAAVLLTTAVLGIDFTLDVENGINAGEMLSTNLGLALLTPFALLVVWALYGVRPRWVSSNRPGFRWSWLLVSVGMALIVYSLFLVLGTAGAAAERDAPLDAAVIGFLGVVLLTTPLQAAGEEYLFRGMLLQALGAVGIPVWGCYVGSGLLFATAHLQFAPPLFADRFVLGVALAYLAVNTGGLETPIAIHAVKNVSVLIPAALLEQTDDALDPTGVTWIPVAIDLVLLAVIVPWAVRVSRRRNGPQTPSDGLRRAPFGPPIPSGGPSSYPGVGQPGWSPYPTPRPPVSPVPPGWGGPPPTTAAPPPPPPPLPPPPKR